MGMNTDAVQRLYVAYFNRPADPVSMSVYESLLPTDRAATQAELQALAEQYFSPSAEYTSLYAGMSNTQIVNQLYQNIFGRAAEVDGLVYWAAELTAGEHLNVLAELVPTVLISRRDRIKQHHPIQTGQTEGLLQTPGLMATAGACITAHQSAAAAMAHQHKPSPATG